MEIVGEKPHEVLNSIHFGSTFPKRSLITHVHALPGGSTVADWHVYAVEWEPGEIRFYVDGVQTCTYDHWWSCSKLEGRRRRGGRAAPADLNPWPAPFDQPFYLVMNVAVGGNFPGAPERRDAVPGRAGGGLRARVRQGRRLRPGQAASARASCPGRRSSERLKRARPPCPRTPQLPATTCRSAGDATQTAHGAALWRACRGLPARSRRRPASAPGRSGPKSGPTPRRATRWRRASAPCCSAACTACASAPTSKARQPGDAGRRGADPRAAEDHPAAHALGPQLLLHRRPRADAAHRPRAGPEDAGRRLARHRRRDQRARDRRA